MIDWEEGPDYWVECRLMDMGGGKTLDLLDRWVNRLEEGEDDDDSDDTKIKDAVYYLEALGRRILILEDRLTESKEVTAQLRGAIETYMEQEIWEKTEKALSEDESDWDDEGELKIPSEEFDKIMTVDFAKAMDELAMTLRVGEGEISAIDCTGEI